MEENNEKDKEKKETAGKDRAMNWKEQRKRKGEEAAKKLQQALEDLPLPIFRTHGRGDLPAHPTY